MTEIAAQVPLVMFGDKSPGQPQPRRQNHQWDLPLKHRKKRQMTDELLHIMSGGSVNSPQSFPAEVYRILYDLVSQDPSVNRRIKDLCSLAGLPSEEFTTVLLQLLSNYARPRLHGYPEVLPDEAPELYVYRGVIKKTGKRENIVEFLRRVWMPWINCGLLTRADLRRLDPSADKAIENWQSKKPLPPEIKIPTKKEKTDIEISSDLRSAMSNPRLARIIASRLQRGAFVPGVG